MFVGCIVLLAVAIVRTTGVKTEDPKLDDMVFYWRSANGHTCKPFTTFMIECNRCVCGADATPSCTRKFCSKIYNLKGTKYMDINKDQSASTVETDRKFHFNRE